MHDTETRRIFIVSGILLSIDSRIREAIQPDQLADQLPWPPQHALPSQVRSMVTW